MAATALCAACAVGCAGIGDQAPHTTVVIDNGYSPSARASLVVVRALVDAVTFKDPILPGASSEPQDSPSSSGSTAYVVLAQGWNPERERQPSALVVMQSRAPIAVELDQALHVAIDDATFVGNCAAGSPLTQAQADFLTSVVFPDLFATVHYDAATCTTTPLGDAGAR